MIKKWWQGFVDQVDLSKLFIKLLFLIEVVGLPIYSLIVAPSAFAPEWQSGKPMDFVLLWFSNRVQIVFYPMIAWAVIALLALMWKFEKSSKIWWIRWGIYMGTVWCWIYLMYELLIIGANFFSKENIVPWLVFLGWMVFLGWLICLNNRNDKHVIIGLCLLFIVLARFQNNPVAGWILGAAFLSTPLVAAILTTALSYRLKNINGARAPKVWTIGFWLYILIALAESIAKVIYEYGKLPKTPPSSCFVVTAAATGHEWIVGNGSQLQNFRDFEKKWYSKLPYSHRIFREVYNVVGPIGAKVVAKNKILADVIYILLKPLELIVRGR